MKVVVTNQKNRVLHLDYIICQKFPLRFEERFELLTAGAILGCAEAAVKIELTQF